MSIEVFIVAIGSITLLCLFRVWLDISIINSIGSEAWKLNYSSEDEIGIVLRTLNAVPRKLSAWRLRAVASWLFSLNTHTDSFELNNKARTVVVILSQGYRLSFLVFLYASLIAMIAGIMSISFNPYGLSRGSMLAVVVVVPNQGTQSDAIMNTETPVSIEQWTGIVIHHSGAAAGNPLSIHNVHLSVGLTGLGYHFIIGNGNGMEDGIIQMGYRWNKQYPGAHVAGPNGQFHNLRSIGICLVGNGDQRPFTKAQLSSLYRLVVRLQYLLDIPSTSVHLHRQLADGVSSPGRFFSEASLADQLLSTNP